MALLSSPYAKTLLAQTRCPVCGAEREELLDERFLITVAYQCTAKFGVHGEGEIYVHSVCPSGSHLAAKTLNDEAAALDVPRQPGKAGA
ncbi:hypothetical protein [Shinella sp.]|uniref:hypothetical protein n=1 Tax=Shinella sp. TaxID=1870904 RepID=UPI0039E36B5A